MSPQVDARRVETSGIRRRRGRTWAVLVAAAVVVTGGWGAGVAAAATSPPAQSPAAQFAGARSPGARSAGARSPGARSPGARSPGARSSPVLTSNAAPGGYSLTRAAQTLARWQSSINAGTPIAQPRTPFAVLYPDADAPPFTFHVRTGTDLYVSVINGDDSPPVAGCPPPGIVGRSGCQGIFPATNAEARHYLFGRSAIDAHATSITVDGVTTPIGPDYLAGPVTAGRLLDSSVPGVYGTHMFFLAAYLRPLAPGRHIVQVNGVFDGPYVLTTYGQTVHESLSFTVDVGCG